MPQHDHLPLIRLPERLERRKHGGGSAPTRAAEQHAPKIRTELATAIASQRRQRPAAFIDPSLILRVQMSGMTMEEDWEALGLTLLSSDADKNLILFSSSDDLADFNERLNAYERAIPAGQRNPRYAGFVNRIDEIGAVEARDRIGIRLREEGFTDADDFNDDETYVLDIELWDIGRRDLRVSKIQEIARYIEGTGGEIFDQYIGPSISMLRAQATGEVVRVLLSVPEIAFVDLPPVPDVDHGDHLELEVGDLPELLPVDENSPIIGILDSGINRHPLLEDVIVGEIGVPDELGTADVWGHGTRVGGIAAFGDLEAQLDSANLSRGIRLVSAKVITDQGEFHERRLLPGQMRETISTLNAEHGCRIFVISLGDTRRSNDEGRVGPWAATLDELASELDVLIIVSSGNRSPRGGVRLEQAVTDYPNYLLEDANRLCEPAGAVNVLTVGALANGNGIAPEHINDANIRPIAEYLEPSPFTRVGPGAAGSTKPDLVDLGGTMIFDAVTRSLRRAPGIPEAGVLTLHHQFLDQLFTTGSGTSYAAPLVAYKAAQILRQIPNASTNLLRALLVGSASVPEESSERLQILGENASSRICGNGLVDEERASFSDDHRVVLYSEDELETDHFAIYRIPVPDVFQTGGRRTIRVCLAYDPPVRRTRADYRGITMNFRVIRGCDENLVAEHFRHRAQDEEAFPEIANRFQCTLTPGPKSRERNSVQSASVTFSRDTTEYGDEYFLVVRCNGGWAAEDVDRQRFAVMVELEHQAQIQIYTRLRGQIRV